MIETDLLVVGGGVNGVGIARDAAGRGLSVFLCEMDDLAQHTSSASTKLIHGGLRYLENYDFRLVRHALREREVLLKAAPHIIWPLRFVLPYHRALRPEWLIRVGLFFYDHLGGRKLLPPSRRIDLGSHPAGRALKPKFTHGFEYSDCWVQDSRLVVLNAMDAQVRGARIRTRTRCVRLRRHRDHWIVNLKDQDTGESYQVRARALINAAGPWVNQILQMDSARHSENRTRLIKGSHIVVSKLFDHEYPYIFQNQDGRVIFAIPFEREFTLLGTTDCEVHETPESLHIDQEELSYICRAAEEYLETTITPEDVVWSYSGVRPLYNDAAASAAKVTRDYMLDLDTDGAPMLSVFGGKITTYRDLAQQAMGLLAGTMSGISSQNWTAEAQLPGGDIENADFDKFLVECSKNFPWLSDDIVYDYARNYGTRITMILAGCGDMQSLGRHFGGPLYEREVEYLMEHEFAHTAQDVLWRRSKKGLLLTSEEAGELHRWMTDKQGRRSE